MVGGKATCDLYNSSRSKVFHREFWGMRNAVFQSFSSQLCSFGNNDVQLQMQNPDVSVMHLDLLKVYGANFFSDSQVCNEQHLGLFAPLSTVESPQTLDNYLPGLPTTTLSMYENISELKPPMKLLSIPRTELGIHQEAIQSSRKRGLKVGDQIHKDPAENESKKKKKKAVCMEDQPSFEKPSLQTQEEKAPVKRSQKLGDRITALQKLVSPFGKTDTASVLHEAAVYIKLLQEQIHTMSVPYYRVRPLHPQSIGGRGADLRSRGLCVVPLSMTQNLTKRDG